MSRIRNTNHREGPILPVWPARLATARLRRAHPWPILARPPVRAIQPCVRLESGGMAITNSLAWRRSKVYELKRNTGWF